MFVWQGNPTYDLLPFAKVIKEAKLPWTLACVLDRVVDGKDRGEADAQLYTHSAGIWYVSILYDYQST